MFVTAKVLKLLKLRLVKDQHPANIFIILVTLPVLKVLKSRVTRV